MIGDDSHKAALIILGKMKKGGAMDAKEPDEHDEGAEDGSSGAEALKGMYDAMKSGDFEAAFNALQVAIEHCKEDEGC